MSQPQYRKETRLLQITDCHLFAEVNNSLLVINTFDSFNAVLAQIKQNDTQFDYAVFTGDLSQDQSAESYQHVAKEIKNWQQPSFWLPGNHDDIPNMQQAFSPFNIDWPEHAILGDMWQMVTINSQVLDCPHGYINHEQLQRLSSILNQYNNLFTIVFLHHHPLLSGSHWLDQHCLHNRDEFWQVLSAFPQVKAVVCGHIHQDLDMEHQGVRVLATPSTCIQFLPNSKDFVLDEKAPGWREITLLEDGSIETVVGRIAAHLFSADMSSTGY